MVSSLCQGVGGLTSEFGTACQSVGDSPDVWSTMRTRRKILPFSNMGGNMAAASPSQFDFVVLEEVLESVAGGCGYWRVVNGGQLRG